MAEETREITNDWPGIIRTMLADGGASHREVSRRMGKVPSYVSATLNACEHGTVPSSEVLAGMAEACGYELHVIGHGRDMRVRSRNPRPGGASDLR